MQQKDTGMQLIYTRRGKSQPVAAKSPRKNQNTYATYERTIFVAANENICSTEITFVAEVQRNISLMCLQQNTHAFAVC
jgi:hypothetical protein